MQRLVKLLLAGLAGVVVGWLLPGVARADVGGWSSAGPSEAIAAVAVDPTHDQRVLAAGASRRAAGPVYRSVARPTGLQRRTATMLRRT